MRRPLFLGRSPTVVITTLALVGGVLAAMADLPGQQVAMAAQTATSVAGPDAEMAAAPGGFVPLAPTMVGEVSLTANGSSSVQVAGVGGVPTSGVTAVAVSVVVDRVQQTTSVRVFPDGAPAIDSDISVWVAAGQGRAATEVVPLSQAGKVGIIAKGGPARVTLRLRGYFTSAPTSGSRFVPLAPATVGSVSLAANGSSSVQVAGVGGVPTSGVTAVAVSVVVDRVDSNTVVRVSPDGASTANNNYSVWVADGQARVTTEVVPLSTAGKLMVTSSGGTSRVTVRLRGYFTSVPDTGANFVPLAPESLGSVSLPADGSSSVQVAGAHGVPVSGAAAVVVSVVVDHVQATTTARVFPDGAPADDISAWATVHDAAVTTEVMPLSATGKLGVAVSGGAARISLRLRGYLAAAPDPLPVEQFSPMTVMQASPVPGALVGTIEYVYTDNIGRVVYGHQTDPENFSTAQYTVISGLEAFTGRPALAEQADGRLQVVGHNTTGDVWVDTQATKDPAVMGPWANVGGPMASHAAIARQSDGTLVVFGLDGSGRLWALRQDGVNGPYPTWTRLGDTVLAGTPVAVVTGTGIQLFAADTDGVLQTASYSGGLLSGWTSLGGQAIVGTPSVVVMPGSRLWVFARALDGSVVTQAQDTSLVFPGVWDTVGTFAAAGAPSALLDPATGRIEVVARGSDGAIYNTGETTQGSGVWRDWKAVTQFGDLAATDPTAFPFTTGTATLWAFAFRRSDNTVRVYTATSTGIVPTLASASVSTGPGFTARSLPAPPNR
ncbi:MAG TPA: hypothetical protein VIR27_18475 [Mycobacteriales bacterium]|jgi:hypothetical protein